MPPNSGSTVHAAEREKNSSDELVAIFAGVLEVAPFGIPCILSGKLAEPNPFIPSSVVEG